MGEISQRYRRYLAVFALTIITIAGPLACSSPIPSHFTIRTAEEGTPTWTPTPIVPTATPTDTATITPTAPPTDTPAASTATATPIPSSTKQLPRKYTRTPTLTLTPTPKLPQGEVYYDDESGFAIVLPADWIAGKEGYVTSLALNEAVWLSDAPNDPLITLVIGPLSEIFDGTLARAKTPDDILLIAGGRLGRDWDAKVTSVTETTFEEYPAASGVIEDGNPDRLPQLTGQAISMLPDDRAVMIWALAPEDQWEEFEPILDAVLNSITFTEPVQSTVTKTPIIPRKMSPTPAPEPTEPQPGIQPTVKRPPAVPTPTPPPQAFSYGKPQDFYVNDWENYSILVPKDWRVYIEEGTLTIAPSVDDFSLEVIRDPMVEVTVGSLSTLWDGAAAGATGPATLLDVATKVQAERGISIISGPTDIQIAGYPALTVELSGQGLGGQLTSVYLGDNRAALIGVLAPADQWPSFAPVFQAMTESLDFSVQ